MTGVVAISEFIDIGFIVVLAASCWYALQRSNDNTSEHASNWKQELVVLRDSLQSLISEASIASHNLDKNLQRRQNELEHLLRQIEKLKNGVDLAELPQRQSDTSEDFSNELDEEPHYEEEEEDLEDFPNASWLEPNRKVSAATEEKPKPSARKKKASPKKKQAAPTDNRSIDQRLKDAIEVSRETDLSKPVVSADNEKRALSIKRPSSVDPIAYKVAKRLLENGQPIHLVARKVELSTAEVRHIYKLLNPTEELIDDELSEEATPPDTFIELKEELSSEEVPVKYDALADEIL